MYNVSIEERPAFTAVGVSVLTNMANAKDDCPSLWINSFTPRVHEFQLDAPCDTFGISRVDSTMQPDQFEYSATVPLMPGKPVPDGMKKIDLPAGTYLRTDPISLSELPGAFEYVYTQWINDTTQPYELVMTAPCYELYPSDFMVTGKLVIYFPVQKK